mmetsp:Transcript_16753/g.41863  ORF Transcript_16753/g.41863 Transcript_16753/m.41863 type:complete len:240 (-) Transcript_16753:76-795(-)
MKSYIYSRSRKIEDSAFDVSSSCSPHCRVVFPSSVLRRLGGTISSSSSSLSYTGFARLRTIIPSRSSKSPMSRKIDGCSLLSSSSSLDSWADIFDAFSCVLPFDKCVDQSPIFSRPPFSEDNLMTEFFLILEGVIDLLGFNACTFMLLLLLLLSSSSRIIGKGVVLGKTVSLRICPIHPLTPDCSPFKYSSSVSLASKPSDAQSTLPENSDRPVISTTLEMAESTVSVTWGNLADRCDW